MSCCNATFAEEIKRPGTVLARETGEAELRAASHALEGGVVQTDFIVPDMHCAACIRSVERALGELPFVERARANLSLKRVSVIWRGEAGKATDLSAALDRAGFAHMPFDQADPGTSDNGDKRLLLCLAVAGFAAANIMLLSVSVWSGADAETAHLFHYISGLIAVPAVFFAGRPFFASAMTALRAGRLNMDVPISLAVLLALAMSLYETVAGGGAVYFDASVTLLFFLLIGRYLDRMMRDRARNAVVALSRLTARGAQAVEKDGSLRYLPLDEIQPGDTLRIAPGERLAVDARVLSGSSDIDRSLVTGESAPEAAIAGREIEAGVLNLTGSLDVEALRDARHSFLAEITRMMEVAEQGRGAYVRIADRMAAIYAPAVHLLAFIAFIAWLFLTGDWHHAVYVAVSVLIVTCPCALGLAVPVVHVIAAARLFERGVFVKHGSAIERLAEADIVLFDKTGTLTTGEPRVTAAAFARPQDAPLAAALAARSTHPVARALCAHLTSGHLMSGHLTSGSADLSDSRETPGYGVEADHQGRRIRLGRADWVNEIASHPAKAESGTAFAVEGGPVTVFELSESLRPGAIRTVQDLAASGMESRILSGDAETPVARIADLLGGLTAEARFSPKDKIDEIQALIERGRKPMMVGDGLNDAPALAAAHVSIAPGSACDVGRLAADFVFTRDSLSAVTFAVKIARAAGTLVRQNFGLAIAYNCIAVPLAMAGYVTPLIAAIAMSASSIVVIANSMRLNLVERKRTVSAGPERQAFQAGLPGPVDA